MSRGNFRKQESNPEVPEEPKENPVLRSAGDEIMKNIDRYLDEAVMKYAHRMTEETVEAFGTQVRARCELITRGVIESMQRRFDSTVEDNTLIIKIKLN